MTGAAFLTKIQNYYGAYKPAQLHDVVTYLSKWNGLYLEGLYQACIYSHSTKWKCTPDIAIFEELRDSARRETKILREALPVSDTPQIEEEYVSPEVALNYLEKMKTKLFKAKKFTKTVKNKRSA